MIKISLAFVLATLTLYSCASRKLSVQVIDDEVANSTVTRLSGIRADLDKKTYGYFTSVEFVVDQYISRPGTDTLYAVGAVCMVIDGLIIEPGSRMEFISDGEVIPLTCNNLSGPKKTHQIGTQYTGPQFYVSETAWFKADKWVIRKMGEGGTVSFAIYGRNKKVEGTIDPEICREIKQFCENYISD